MAKHEQPQQCAECGKQPPEVTLIDCTTCGKTTCNGECFTLHKAASR